MTNKESHGAAGSGVDEAEIRKIALLLATQREPGKTICPSEVARGTGAASWRDMMPAVHSVLNALRREDRIVISQKGVPVTTDEKIGPYRFYRKA